MTKTTHLTAEQYKNMKFVRFRPKYFTVDEKTFDYYCGELSKAIDKYLAKPDIMLINNACDSILHSLDKCMTNFSESCVSRKRPMHNNNFIHQINLLQDVTDAIYGFSMEYLNWKRYSLSDSDEADLQAALFFLNYATHVIINNEVYAELYCAIHN